jgi:hypothetical protein
MCKVGFNSGLITTVFCCLVGLSASQAQQGMLFFPNPLPNHYFIAPSGFAFPPKARYYSNQAIIFQQFNAATRYHAEFGLGFVPTFFMRDWDGYMPILLSGIKRFRQAPYSRLRPFVGAFWLNLPEDEDEEGDAWMLLGGVTQGRRERHCSVSLFVLRYSDEESSVVGGIFSGMVRAGKHSWLISENYLVWNNQQIVPLCLAGWRRQWHRFFLHTGVGWFKIPGGLQGNERSMVGAFPWVGMKVALRKGTLKKVV